jgi:DNA-binding Lrp family transcriptional regulator
MRLDGLDRTVLEVLLAHGRATLRDLAQEADLSTATVADRVQALEDDGVVTGYTPRLDHERLGHSEAAVFRVTVNQSMLPTVRRRLADADRLVTVYEVTGDVDVVAIGRFRSSEDVEEQRRALFRVPGVTDVATARVERTVRDHADPPLAPDGHG